MIKHTVFIFIIIFMVGCGSPKGEQHKAKEAKNNSQSAQYIAKGMRYLAQKKILKAVESFDLAIKADPTNTDNYIILGEIYLRLKNYTRAIDTFSAALRVNPFSAEAYYLLAVSQALRGEKADKAQAVKALKRSIHLFARDQKQDNLKKAILLLKSLTDQETPQKQ